MLQDEKKRALAAAIINEEAKAATALLKKRKREIKDAEAVLQTKHTIKQSSLDGPRRSADGKSWIDSPASARACPQHR